MTRIKKCTRCLLYKNQPPILDDHYPAEIMWVGLSAKKVENIQEDIPLSKYTRSGKILNQIEEELGSVRFYKTNIVKCLPLDEKNKIRYPSIDEMKICNDNFNFEIERVNPKIIFLLGERVSKFVFANLNLVLSNPNCNYEFNIYKHDNKYFIPIQHPSYISVYKRKEADRYRSSIQNIINNHLNGLALKEDL